MTLRKKTLLTILFTFLGLSAVVLLIAQSTLLKYFEDNEKQRVALNTHRAVDAVNETLGYMDRVAADWAVSENTVDFIQTKNPDYITNNLNNNSLTKLQLDFVLFLDTSGGLVYAKTYDWENQKPGEIPATFLNDLRTRYASLQLPDSESGKRGVFAFAQHPALIVSRSIIPSNGQGAALGTLIFGRYANGETFKNWQELTGLNLDATAYSLAEYEPDFSKAKNILQSEMVFSSPLGPNLIGGYALLNDSNGIPSYILRIMTDRTIYQDGQMVLRYLVLMIMLAGLIFGGITMFLLERFVLVRLSTLSDQVNEIAESGNTSSRVSLSSSDELSVLAKKINQMLAHIEQMQGKYRQSEERFRQIIEQMPYPVQIFGADGTCLNVNQALLDMHGISNRNLLIGTTNILEDEPGKGPGLDEQIRRAFEGEIVNIPEVAIQSAGDEQKPEKRWPIYQELTFFPVKSGSRISQVVMIAQDISMRKAHESEREVVYAVASALRRARNLSEMLPVILAQILSLLSANSAAILLRDSEDDIVCELGRGVWAEYSGSKIPAARVARQAITTGQLYLNNSVRHFTSSRQFVENIKMNASVSYPLIAEDKVIGELCVGRLEGKISDADILILATVANIAASAIHRTMLLEKTQLRIQRLNVLNRIDSAFTLNLDIRFLFNMVLEEITTSLKVNAAQILVFDPDSNRFYRAAWTGFRSPVSEVYPTVLHDYHAYQIIKDDRPVYIADLGKTTRSQRPKPAAEESFISLFSVPLFSKGEFKGLLELFHRSHFEGENEWLSFLQTLAGQIGLAIDNAALFESLQQSNLELSLAYDATLKGWGRAMALRDGLTEDHSQRVAELTVHLAEKLGLPREVMVNLQRGAILHDIGKMGIPDNILKKPGPLTEEERLIMKKHPLYADELLNPIQFLRPALIIPRYHHEKWDGTGYPNGLKGEQIPLEARIFAVVDVWDALISDRPYRSHWSLDKTLEYLHSESGKHFDPEVVGVFLKEINNFSSQNPAPNPN